MQDIKPFIEKWHYSHTIFGCTISACFKIFSLLANEIVGAAIFGLPASVGVKEKYCDGGNLLELRKFCMADWCPKNSESQTLAVMLRMLKKDGVDVVLTYADPAHGHCGTIYKACGFSYLGVTAARKHFMWKGKKYPDRNVHQTNFPYHLELRAAVASGEATKVAVPGKHIFLKKL